MDEGGGPDVDGKSAEDPDRSLVDHLDEPTPERRLDAALSALAPESDPDSEASRVEAARTLADVALDHPDFAAEYSRRILAIFEQILPQRDEYGETVTELCWAVAAIADVDPSTVADHVDTLMSGVDPARNDDANARMVDAAYQVSKARPDVLSDYTVQCGSILADAASGEETKMYAAATLAELVEADPEGVADVSDALVEAIEQFEDPPIVHYALMALGSLAERRPPLVADVVEHLVAASEMCEDPDSVGFALAGLYGVADNQGAAVAPFAGRIARVLTTVENDLRAQIGLLALASVTRDEPEALEADTDAVATMLAEWDEPNVVANAVVVLLQIARHSPASVADHLDPILVVATEHDDAETAGTAWETTMRIADGRPATVAERVPEVAGGLERAVAIGSTRNALHALLSVAKEHPEEVLPHLGEVADAVARSDDATAIQNGVGVLTYAALEAPETVADHLDVVASTVESATGQEQVHNPLLAMSRVATVRPDAVAEHVEVVADTIADESAEAVIENGLRTLLELVEEEFQAVADCLEAVVASLEATDRASNAALALGVLGAIGFEAPDRAIDGADAVVTVPERFDHVPTVQLAAKYFQQLSRSHPEALVERTTVLSTLFEFDDAGIRREVLSALAYVAEQRPDDAVKHTDLLVRGVRDADSGVAKNASLVFWLLADERPGAIADHAKAVVEGIDGVDATVATQAVATLYNVAAERTEAVTPHLDNVIAAVERVEMSDDLALATLLVLDSVGMRRREAVADFVDTVPDLVCQMDDSSAYRVALRILTRNASVDPETTVPHATAVGRSLVGTENPDAVVREVVESASTDDADGTATLLASLTAAVDSSARGDGVREAVGAVVDRTLEVSTPETAARALDLSARSGTPVPEQGAAESPEVTTRSTGEPGETFEIDLEIPDPAEVIGERPDAGSHGTFGRVERALATLSSAPEDRSRSTLIARRDAARTLADIASENPESVEGRTDAVVATLHAEMSADPSVTTARRTDERRGRTAVELRQALLGVIEELARSNPGHPALPRGIRVCLAAPDPSVVGEALEAAEPIARSPELSREDAEFLADALAARLDDTGTVRDAARLLETVARRYPGAVVDHTGALATTVEPASGGGFGQPAALPALQAVAEEHPDAVAEHLDAVIEALDLPEWPHFTPVGAAKIALAIVQRVARANPAAVAGHVDEIVTALESYDRDDVTESAFETLGIVGEHRPKAVAAHVETLLEALDRYDGAGESAFALVTMHVAVDVRPEFVEGRTDRVTAALAEAEEQEVVPLGLQTLAGLWIRKKLPDGYATVGGEALQGIEEPGSVLADVVEATTEDHVEVFLEAILSAALDAAEPTETFRARIREGLERELPADRAGPVLELLAGVDS